MPAIRRLALSIITVEKNKMGLHRDEDEAELRAPIVSASLGDSALSF